MIAEKRKLFFSFLFFALSIGHSGVRLLPEYTPDSSVK